MVANKIQFAIVREDPLIEIEAFRLLKNPRKVCMIGSGGCTALELRSHYYDLEITLLEPNSAQIDLIRKKFNCLKQGSLEDRLRVINAFNTSGNFESLFRGLREFIYEFVCEQPKWDGFFAGQTLEFKNEVFSSKYWPVAFDLFFSDSLLNAMFGPDATQHAVPGSYPSYFRKVLEKGLSAAEARTNYFLHHIFLGHYLEGRDCLPKYLYDFPQNAKELKFVESLAQNAGPFSEFDLVSLSNIFDWMGESDIQTIARRLVTEMKSGSLLIYRQLNNNKNLEEFFAPSFEFQKELANELHSKDRSLFYSSIHIGRKK